MDEETMRTDYWVDNRSDRQFPLWVIFRLVGRDQNVLDGLPYTRLTKTDVVTLLKKIEQHVLLEDLAHSLDVHPQELTAALWYVIWLVEQTPASKDPHWVQWNKRVDQAWEAGWLKRSEPSEGRCVNGRTDES